MTVASINLLAQTKKDGWFKKFWHNTNARYNSYFHAKEILNETKFKIIETKKDNFGQILDVYPWGDETSLKGNLSSMDEIHKKTSHLINKHPKSKWVDDSYLLIGQSQFFKGDFFAGIETFEYITYTYKESELVMDAQLWILLCHLHKKNLADAEAMFTLLNNNEKFPNRLKGYLYAAGADIYIKQKKYNSAIQYLEKALQYNITKYEKMRYHFILGQLYQKNSDYTKSVVYFKKTTKLNPPYDFAFHSKLSMVKGLGIAEKTSRKKARNLLLAMLKDDKNIDYYAQIHYELGILELADNNKAAATQHFSKSLRTNQNNMPLKVETYLKLGELYFEVPDYAKSQAYYDSAVQFIDPNDPLNKTIFDRNDVLGDLIKNLVVIKEQDSLIKLAEDEKLREKTIDKIILWEEEQKSLQNTNPTPDFNPNMPAPPPTAGSFPFYNPIARSRGYNDFVKNWGNRTYKENWRISSIKSFKEETPDNNNDTSSVAVKGIPANTPEERKKYYKNIPLTKEAMALSKEQMAESYFKAAVIYFEKLEENQKAKELLLTSIQRFPDNKYESNSLYMLAKICKAEKNNACLEEYKQKLAAKYPESEFLKVLNQSNTDSLATATKYPKSSHPAELEDLYRKMFDLYKNGNYEQAIATKNDAYAKFPGNTLEANFEYLHALCLGRLGKKEEYFKKLESIVEDYPGTEVSEEANSTLNYFKSKESENGNVQNPNEFVYKASNQHFFLLKVKNGSNLNDLKALVSDFNKANFILTNLTITTVAYNSDYQLVLVSGFKNLKEAMNYRDLFMQDKTLNSKLSGLSEQNDYMVIDQDNFNKMLSNKKLPEYIEFCKKYYKL